MRHLTKEEYTKRINAFIDRHKEEIKSLLSSERKKCIEQVRNTMRFRRFLKDYMGGFFLCLIVGVAGMLKGVFSLSDIGGFLIIQFVVLGWAYGAWTDESKRRAENDFDTKRACEIIEQYMRSERIREHRCASTWEESLLIEEFYLDAIHDLRGCASLFMEN